MKIAQPTPELQVPDVASAQIYYRDRLGFEIKWTMDDGEIGAVAHGPCAIFFRRTEGEPSTGTFWIFADDVDAAHDALQERGAAIIDPIGDKPWGMRQFTVEDAFGNRFHFHHDL